jgi:hypothetical protein
VREPTDAGWPGVISSRDPINNPGSGATSSSLCLCGCASPCPRPIWWLNSAGVLDPYLIAACNAGRSNAAINENDGMESNFVSVALKPSPDNGGHAWDDGASSMFRANRHGGGSCWRRRVHPCVCTHLADETSTPRAQVPASGGAQRRCATPYEGGMSNCSARARDTIANALDSAGIMPNCQVPTGGYCSNPPLATVHRESHQIIAHSAGRFV